MLAGPPAHRLGGFGPARETQGVESFARTDVTAVGHDGDRGVVFGFAAGTARPLFVSKTGKLSNQQAFLDDVPRLLVASGAARAAAA